MKHLLFLALVPLNGQGQSITYNWSGIDPRPNTYAVFTDPSFAGRMAVWHGVETCMTASAEGREFISEPWPTDPGSAHLRLSCLAFKATRLDSIIITHRGAVNGPQRMRLSLIDADNRLTVIGEAMIAPVLDTVSIPLSKLMVPTTGEYDQLVLLIEPYGGMGGPWFLRSIRMLGTAMEEVAGPDASDQRLVKAGNR